MFKLVTVVRELAYMESDFIFTQESAGGSRKDEVKWIIPSLLEFLQTPSVGLHQKHSACVSLQFLLTKVLSSDHIDYTRSRYRSRIRRAYNIVAAIYRTISCTNARLARALLTYRSVSV